MEKRQSYEQRLKIPIDGLPPIHIGRGFFIVLSNKVIETYKRIHGDCMKIYKIATFDPVEINKNMDEFFTTRQNQDPEGEDFAVDSRSPSKTIPTTQRKRANRILQEVGRKYWPSFPLDEIFGACKSNDIIPLQEDGTVWAGMIGSQGDCGLGKPPMTIDLAVNVGEGYVPARNRLIITACTMTSGNLEIVCYVS